MRRTVQNCDGFGRNDRACVIQNVDLERMVASARLKFLKRQRRLITAARGRRETLLDRVAVDGFITRVKADRSNVELHAAVAGGIIVCPTRTARGKIPVGQKLGRGRGKPVANDKIVTRPTRQRIRAIDAGVGRFIQPRCNDRNAIIRVTGRYKDAAFDIHGLGIQQFGTAFGAVGRRRNLRQGHRPVRVHRDGVILQPGLFATDNKHATGVGLEVIHRRDIGDKVIRLTDKRQIIGAVVVDRVGINAENDDIIIAATNEQIGNPANFSEGAGINVPKARLARADQVSGKVVALRVGFSSTRLIVASRVLEGKLPRPAERPERDAVVVAACNNKGFTRTVGEALQQRRTLSIPVVQVILA